MLNLQMIGHKSVIHYHDHEVIPQNFTGGPEEGYKKKKSVWLVGFGAQDSNPGFPQ